MDRTTLLRSAIPLAGRGLEIGPSYNPLVPKAEGHRVEIVDYTDAEGLRAKYHGNPHVDVRRIEPVDHVVGGGRGLAETVGQPGAFDYVVASHVIEHTPDMLGFLRDCQSLLAPDGVLLLAVPDKRHCFDVLQPLSSTGSVLQAHLDRRARPTPGAIFDDVAYNAVRNGAIGWTASDNGTLDFFAPLEAARSAYEAAVNSPEYRDVHVWRYVPSSFRLIVADLHAIGALHLRESWFHDSVGNEFYVTLSRAGAGCAVDRITLAQQALTEQAAILLQHPATRPDSAPPPREPPPERPAAPSRRSPAEPAAEATTEAIPRDDAIRREFDALGLCLEIGPSYSPILPKSAGYRVEIADHTDREGLLRKYGNEPSVDCRRIEEVDHVVTGSLFDAIGTPGRYDAIIASNVAEHTPDLAGFLLDCQRLLKPTGRLVLVNPDKRRCFDVFRPVSTTGQVLQAHAERRTRHTPGLIFDHMAALATRGGAAAWHSGDTSPFALAYGTAEAYRHFEAMTQQPGYVDCHAWVFTPSSFRLIAQDLADLGVTELREERFVPSLGLFEFLVTLSPGGPGCPLDRLSLCKAVLSEQSALRTG